MKPRSVVIGKIKWKILWNKNIVKNDGASGMTVYSLQEIWIDKSLDEISKRHVFLHEILHAIWYSYSFTPRLSDEHFEEDVVSQFPPAILQVIDDNPSVARYILGLEEK